MQILNKMDWIVFTVKPNQSNKAEANLKAQDMQCFFPRVCVLKDQKKKLKDLFPGYGFVKLSNWAQLQLLSSTRGINRILAFNNKIPTISDSIIDGIRESIFLFEEDKDKKIPKKGDEVIINAKILKGMQATVMDTLERKGSRVLLLQIFNQPQTIWIDASNVYSNLEFISDI